VNVTPNVECKLAKKSTSIRVQTNDQAIPTFTKDGPNKLLLTWPTCPAVPEPQQNNRNSSRAPLSNMNGNVHITNGHNNGQYANGNGGVKFNNNMNGGSHHNSVIKPSGPAPPPPIPQRIQSIQASNGY